MTGEQVVAYLLEGEGLDFLRESLTWVCQQLMEAEVSELVGAARGERAPDERLTHRNGYRSRAWATRAGETIARLDSDPDAGCDRPLLSSHGARQPHTCSTSVS